VIELVKVYLAAEGVPVNAEQARGARLVAPRTVQHPLDKFLFESASSKWIPRSTI